MNTQTYDRLERTADRAESAFIRTILAGTPQNHPARMHYYATGELWQLIHVVRVAEKAQSAGDARSVFAILESQCGA